MNYDLTESTSADYQAQTNARSVVARILADPTQQAWKSARDLPTDAFLHDPDSRSIWAALQAGACYANHLDISKRSGVSLDAIQSLLMEDPVGAEGFFKTRLAAVRDCDRKRKLRILGNEIHESKTPDVERWKDRLDALREVDGDASPDAKLRERLGSRRFNFETPPAEPTPRFLINGKAFSTPGNLTNFIAQAKAGKTAFIAACIAATICAEYQTAGDTLGVTATAPGPLRLIHFDTEQSLFDHDTLVRRALRRASASEPPPWLSSYGLAGFTAHDLREALRHVLAEAQAAGGVFAVIIDGTADLVNDVNDPEECNAFVADLQALAIAHDCPIINVVHENPGQDGGKMRGHLGSQLERKAESNIRLKKTEEITVVFSDKMRRAPILEKDGPRFAWSDEDGMHVSVEAKITLREAENLADLRSLAEEVFLTGTLRYADACKKIEDARRVGTKAGEKWFSRMRKGSVITSAGFGQWRLKA